MGVAMVEENNSKTLSPQEVVSILKNKYKIPQRHIDFFDDESRLDLLKGFQSIPMLNEEEELHVPEHLRSIWYGEEEAK